LTVGRSSLNGRKLVLGLPIEERPNKPFADDILVTLQELPKTMLVSRGTVRNWRLEGYVFQFGEMTTPGHCRACFESAFVRTLHIKQLATKAIWTKARNDRRSPKSTVPHPLETNPATRPLVEMRPEDRSPSLVDTRADSIRAGTEFWMPEGMTLLSIAQRFGLSESAVFRVEPRRVDLLMPDQVLNGDSLIFRIRKCVGTPGRDRRISSQDRALNSEHAYKALGLAGNNYGLRPQIGSGFP
jgi:hypothetical protein